MRPWATALGPSPLSKSTGAEIQASFHNWTPLAMKPLLLSLSHWQINPTVLCSSWLVAYTLEFLEIIFLINMKHLDC